MKFISAVIPARVRSFCPAVNADPLRSVQPRIMTLNDGKIKLGVGGLAARCNGWAHQTSDNRL